MKKIALALLLATLIFALAACTEDEEIQTPVAQLPPADEPAPEVTDAAPETTDPTPDYQATVEVPPMPEWRDAEWNAPDDLYNPDNLQVLQGQVAYMLQSPAVMLQLSPLTPGEELAILHTNMGDITLRFFPEEAPIAVANFKTHARAGYYDGLVFHRVIPNFMIQGGCPLGTGTGGESVWGGRFGTEISHNLRHFRGAVAMAHAGPGTIGSQFYIVQNNHLDSNFVNEFTALLEYQDEPIGILPDGTRIYISDIHPVESLEHFMEHGGTPHLDWFWNAQGPHPVFAHVISGLDVVDVIANTPQGANNRPMEDMIIERITFRIYE